METRSIEPLKIKSEVGQEAKIENLATNVNSFWDKRLKELKAAKKKLIASISDKQIKEQLIKDGKIEEKDGIVFDKFPSGEGFKRELSKAINFIGFENVGVIKPAGKRYKVFSNKKISDETGREIHLEAATDNSALFDLPYQQGFGVFPYYVINGKVFSGWGLYYSPSCLRSPEDYAKTIDIIYNVPYLFAALDMKSKLGLGADFTVTDFKHGRTDIEKYSEWLLKKKLKINRNFRKKFAFHRYGYGNAYAHIKWDEKGVPEKLTILQPERVKIYLDSLTQKILFYVYLPPIIGATQAVPYYGVSTRELQGALMQAPALRYPSPIVIPVKDMIHWMINNYTEYPFGFSVMKSAIDVAQARFDVNLLAPYYFKKYCKPMLHASYLSDGESPGKLKKQRDEMKGILEDLEPGSDLITMEKWAITVINPATGQSEIFNLTADLDSQLFAVTGVPETYFKPRGTTDRMISEADKELFAELTQEQQEFAGIIFDRILKPALDKKFGDTLFKKQKEGTKERKETKETKKVETANVFLTKEDTERDVNFREQEVMEDWEKADEYPQIKFEEVTKKDVTQNIANTMSLLSSGIIDINRAAKKVGEMPPSENLELQKYQEQLKGAEQSLEEDFARMTGGMEMNRKSKSDKPLSPEGKNKIAPNQVIGAKKSSDIGTVRLGEKKYPIRKKGG